MRARVRMYRCVDCPPDAPALEGPKTGPLPERCPEHKVARGRHYTNKHHEKQRKILRKAVSANLHLVQEDDEELDEGARAVEPAEPRRRTAPVEQPSPVPGAVHSRLMDELEALDSAHPFAGTLSSVAQTLAIVIDNEVSPRTVDRISKELRALLDQLANYKEEDEDDLFKSSGPEVTDD